MTDAPDDYITQQDARIEETFEIRKALVQDLDELSDPSNRNHQGARRAYVRGVFALIEAMTYRMKASALEIGRAHLDSAEILLLEDREYYMENDGSLRSRVPRLKTLSNLRFTLAMLMKASGVKWTPRYDGPGWAAVNDAIKTRDRLMHPRELSDIEVSDEQLGKAVTALVWFTSTQLKLLGNIHEKQARDAGRPHLPLPGMDSISAMMEENLA